VLGYGSAEATTTVPCKYDAAGEVRYRQDAVQAQAGRVWFQRYDFAGRPLVEGEATATFPGLDPDQTAHVQPLDTRGRSCVHFVSIRCLEPPGKPRRCRSASPARRWGKPRLPAAAWRTNSRRGLEGPRGAARMGRMARGAIRPSRRRRPGPAFAGDATDRLGSNRGSRICSTLPGFRNRSVPFVFLDVERGFSFERFVSLGPITVRWDGFVSRMCPASGVHPGSIEPSSRQPCPCRLPVSYYFPVRANSRYQENDQRADLR
jgi:hypothetical protein